MQFNFTFVLQPNINNGLQTPIDELCTDQLKSALIGNENMFYNTFTVPTTNTCPGVQLETPKLTFQEPVPFCLSGEPVYSVNKVVSCLEAKGMAIFFRVFIVLGIWHCHKLTSTTD